MSNVGTILVKTVSQNGGNSELSFNSKSVKKDYDFLINQLQESGINGFIAFKNTIIVNRNIVYITYFDRRVLSEAKKNEELLDGGNNQD